MIVQFPRSRMRRILSRRPRRSKNGTPEDRAAQRTADEPAELRVIQRRKSKNGTFEQREAKRTAVTAAVVAFTPPPKGKSRRASPPDLYSSLKAAREELGKVIGLLEPNEPEPAA